MIFDEYAPRHVADGDSSFGLVGLLRDTLLPCPRAPHRPAESVFEERQLESIAPLGCASRVYRNLGAQLCGFQPADPGQCALLLLSLCTGHWYTAGAQQKKKRYTDKLA